ncbi:MAG: DUF4230 domain-containing protein, partial [Clostridia bacterium]|nr:DUF4230 domain-containing protein [Clostridia bacterium]
MKKAIAIILLVLVLLGAAFVVANKLDLFSGTKATTYVYDDEEEQMEKLGKLKGKITDAVVGEAKENAELIVCEREVSVKQTWDKSWGDWGIFSKTKTMIIHGTGIYTVDLSKLSANDITVDEEKLTVTIDVPDAKLKTVDIDLPATEFED